MDWGTFYKGLENGVSELIGNIAVHKDFISCICDNAPIKTANTHRLLEIGTGSGTMGIFLSYLGYKVVSIDNNKNVLINAKKKELMNTAGDLKLLYEDAFNMSFDDESFDIAFAQGFFEHFSDAHINLLLNEQLRVAKTVVFSVPSFWYPNKDMGNERLMKIDAWNKVLSSFNVSKSFYYDYNRRIRKCLTRRPMQICFVINSQQ